MIITNTKPKITVQDTKSNLLVQDVRSRLEVEDIKSNLLVQDIKPRLQVSQEEVVYYDSSLLSGAMPSGLLMAITYPVSLGTVRHIRD